MTLDKPPRAVIFDWDGTLVDSWPVINASMDRTLEAMGHDVPEEAGGEPKRGYRSLRDTFPEMFGDRWELAQDIFYSHYRALHLTHIRKMEGAEAMITGFHELGCVLAVVSNKSGSNLRLEATHLGWDGYFGGRLVGAQDAARDKPAVDPVLLALEGTGIDPSGDVWFIGDTWIDIACANAANCRSILIGNADLQTGPLERHPPHAHFESSLEFLQSCMLFGESH